MKKSVYSLVLSDDVVEAIDELAYRMNTSRSNLINQILAERVSCVTPEKRMRSIFDCIREVMDSQFQIQAQGSDAMLSMRSPLRYKYKPTIRYRVELFRDPEDVFGKLSVSFRTQSMQLINALESFFKIWIALERQYIGKFFRDGIYYEYENGRFVRGFKLPEQLEKPDSDDLGGAIGEYIQSIDMLIKFYFANIDSPGDTLICEMEKKYADCLEKQAVII